MRRWSVVVATRLAALGLAACATAPRDPPPLHGTAPSAPTREPGFCVERERPCGHGSHVELIAGRPVTVLDDGTDCVGPRSVECTLADGRHEIVAGATDVEGLGGGGYRYLAWSEGRSTLVTVAGGTHRREPGGAPRTYGPFGPYRLTAESLDGRIAAHPDPAPDDTLTGITVRDTVANRELVHFVLPVPIPSGQDRRVVLARDGGRVAICGRHEVRLVDREVPVPGLCLSADDALAQVIVHAGIRELAVVDLTAGPRAAFTAVDAVFAGRDAIVLVRPRARDPKVDHVTYQPLDGGPLHELGEVPFVVDELRVAPDARTVVLRREPIAGQPARAFLLHLPDGPGHELEIPDDTVAVTLVP